MTYQTDEKNLNNIHSSSLLKSEGWFLRNEGSQGVKMLGIMTAGTDSSK